MQVDFAYLNNQLQRRANEIFEGAQPIVRDLLVEAAPEKTGETKRSFRFGGIGRTPTSLSREVMFTADQALFTDAGTRPHRISVKTAKVLSDGATIFGTNVNHPGTPATKWFTGNIQAFWTQALQQAAGRG